MTFDNRGFGKSDNPAGPYTSKTLAGDTLALMGHLGTKKAHIVGGKRFNEEVLGFLGKAREGPHATLF